MTTNTNNNNSNTAAQSLAGAFSSLGIQSKLGNRVAQANNLLKEALPVVQYPVDGAFAEVPAGIEGDETGEVRFAGSVINILRNEDGLKLAWGMKYSNPAATRDSEGRNTQATTLVANAWKSEARVKDILSALSMIRRNVVNEVSNGLIVESGKIIVNMMDASIQVNPVVLGGSISKPIVQKGRSVLMVGDRKFVVTYRANLDLAVAKESGAGWMAFQRVGSTYTLANIISGDQAAIYEFLVQILSTGCDVFLKGLNKWTVAKNPAAILAKPELVPYFDARTMRFHTFSMYTDKVIATLTASTSEAAQAVYAETMKENAVAAVNHGLMAGAVKASVADTKAGELKPASDLFGQTIVLDAGWVVSERGAQVLKTVKKHVVKIEDSTALDLSKFNGIIFLSAVNAETHLPVKGIDTLRIDSTGVKGEGKHANLDTETREGKGNLKALAQLTNVDLLTVKVAWVITNVVIPVAVK